MLPSSALQRVTGVRLLTLGCLLVLLFLGTVALPPPAAGSAASSNQALPRAAAVHVLPAGGTASQLSPPSSLSPSPSVLLNTPASTFGRALHAVLPYLDQPHQLPNLTGSLGNITGFLASPSVATTGLGNAVAAQLNSTVGYLPSGGSSSEDFLFSLLGEEVSSNSTAFVGYVVASEGALSGGLPLFLVINGTTLSQCGFGSNLLSSGSEYSFSMQVTHGDWWTFEEDGQAMAGSLIGSALGLCTKTSTNGTVDLYGSDIPLESAPLFAWLIPGNATGIHPQYVQTVSWLDVTSLTGGGSSWQDSLVGILALDEGVGVAGYNQDKSVPPDSLWISPTLPILTATTLWNTTALPQLGVEESGIPAIVDCGQGVPFSLWVNDTSTKPPTPTAATPSENSSLGGRFVAGTPGPLPGEYHFTFYAPLTASNRVSDTLTFTAAALDYVSGLLTISVTVYLTDLSVVAPDPFVRGWSGSDLTLAFTVETTAGVPVDTVAPPAVSVIGGGAAHLAVPSTSGVGNYLVNFTAPLVSSMASSNVVLLAGGVGYVASSASITVATWPRAASLPAPASGMVYAGSTFSVPFTLALPDGGTPGATTTWWNATALASDGGQALASALVVQGSGASSVLTVALSPDYVGPLTFWMNVSSSGFNATGVSWTDNVTGNLTVQFLHSPGQLSAGSTTTLTVEVLGVGGTPLAQALVVWTANLGSLGTGSSRSVDLYTDAQGEATVAYHAPSVENYNPTYYLNVTASDSPFYLSSSRGLEGDVVASSPGLFGGGSTLVPLAVVLLIIAAGIVVALFLGRRNRREWEAQAAPASSGALGISLLGEEDARAPAPGASTGEDSDSLGEEAALPRATPAPAQVPSSPKVSSQPVKPGKVSKPSPATTDQGTEEGEEEQTARSGAGSPAAPSTEATAEEAALPAEAPAKPAVPAEGKGRAIDPVGSRAETDAPSSEGSTPSSVASAPAATPPEDPSPTEPVPKETSTASGASKPGVGPAAGAKRSKKKGRTAPPAG